MVRENQGLAGEGAQNQACALTGNRTLTSWLRGRHSALRRAAGPELGFSLSGSCCRCPRRASQLTPAAPRAQAPAGLPGSVSRSARRPSTSRCPGRGLVLSLPRPCVCADPGTPEASGWQAPSLE